MGKSANERARDYQRRKRAEFLLLPEEEQAAIKAQRSELANKRYHDNIDERREIARKQSAARRRDIAAKEGREFGRIGIEIAATDEDRAARKEAKRLKKIAYDAARYAANPDQKKQAAAAYFEANRDIVIQRVKSRYIEKSTEILAKQAKSRLDRIALDPEFRKKEYEACKRRMEARVDHYREVRRKSAKTRRLRNLAAIRLKQKERYWSNPNRARQQAIKDAANRRARKLKAGGKFSSADILALRDLQKGKCSFCLKMLGSQTPHVDHYVPLARGGTNDRGNLRLLCRDCNLSKHAKHPLDFARQNGMLCW